MNRFNSIPAALVPGHMHINYVSPPKGRKPWMISLSIGYKEELGHADLTSIGYGETFFESLTNAVTQEKELIEKVERAKAEARKAKEASKVETDQALAEMDDWLDSI